MPDFKIFARVSRQELRRDMLLYRREIVASTVPIPVPSRESARQEIRMLGATSPDEGRRELADLYARARGPV